ncbi:hypothetical protein IFM89_014054 [Coptis chinensis]|uniref:Uncharacterized protein n=1 Tax=Coptis chinensis TaxID=261450 RepID=A0A835HMD9_9MAGN|nr:hypothetical protein IFM89_014054 [Coptis chinensis]
MILPLNDKGKRLYLNLERVDEMMDFAASEPIRSLGFGKWDKLKSSDCRKDHQFAYLSFIGSFLANFLRTPLASEVDGDIVLYF